MPGPLGHLRDLHCGNGLFFEQVYPDVGSFFRSLTDKEQTLSVFGYSADDIQRNVDLLSARALDRVTQVGSALAFDTVWDGIDLLQAFTRHLSITL